VAQSVNHLPLARVVIPGSWDRVPYLAPCTQGNLLLPLRLTLLSLSNKILKKIPKNLRKFLLFPNNRKLLFSIVGLMVAIVVYLNRANWLLSPSLFLHLK